MNNRIKDLRTIYLKEKTGKKCTQQEFADRLGLSQNFIWQIEKGERDPSDRTISDICREFNVNREWLETGAGKPFQEKSRDEEIAEIIGKIVYGDESSKATIIRALCKLPDEMFPEAERILIGIVENIKKERENEGG